ncbi:reverse transcriptase domain-containing protein [Aureivirga marina]|uniref:reverse transcriptase domain-containing protein n=1 Tax=Aureivirga marina TaxID=1182451 RepID=UPI0018CB25D2|nr:reverse transcriptase domain-containing protein [Aureivirga marina]
MDYDWLKFKRYPHIGKPLNKKKDKAWVLGYVQNPDKIAKHKFVPLIHRTMSQRKYRPLKSASKNKFGKRERTVCDKKIRKIYYPSHLDSIIYSYYNFILTNKYENYIKNKPFKDSPVAYRKIPIGNERKGNKSNIEFAFEAFNFLEKNKSRKLSIIVADVTSFFDNLDHKILKTQWKKILEVNELPKDHYALYKNLVSKKYVYENDLFKRFQNKLIIERFKPHNTNEKELKRKYIKKIYNLRKENVVAFCTKKDFFNEATDLIRVEKPYKDNLRKNMGKEVLKGIPQGTPLSATLANIYMLDFDEKIYKNTSENSKKGFYQRYSDDLIIICDQKDEKYFYNLIKREVEIISKLEIQRSKTNIYRYELDVNNNFHGGIFEDGKLNSNKQLEYLGFMYDGKKIRIKTAGFSQFYRKMNRSFKRGTYFAKKNNSTSEFLYETRLYKKYTHVGSKRKMKWIKVPNTEKKYIKSNYYDWGNFLSYIHKADNIMSEINKDNSIKKQYSNVWKNFHKLKIKAYEEIKSKKKL